MDRQEYTRSSCGITGQVIPNSPRTQLYNENVRLYKEYLKKNNILF